MKAIKRICISSVILALLFMSDGVVTKGYAQGKTDIVIMLNGEIKEGKVIGIQANTVKFSYTGEELEYELQKQAIHKIQFSTGRIEVINEAPQPDASPSQKASQSAASLADRKNKIAVLPFEVVSNDPGLQSAQMSKQLQSSCAGSLREHTSNIIVQDPITTNRLLAKHNIDLDNPATVDPEKLAVLLGVEYVVFGTLDVMNKGTISTGSAGSTYKDKEKRSRDKNSQDTKASGTATSSSNTITSANYDTRVGLTIYTDQGSNYYSKSRNSFGNEIDSYLGTLNYLIKRTPFGSKSR